MTEDDLRAWCHAEMRSSVLEAYERGRAVLALLDRVNALRADAEAAAWQSYDDGALDERRRTIAFLIKLGLRLTAVRIEAGDHWGDE